jgi:hypothetical protein
MREMLAMQQEIVVELEQLPPGESAKVLEHRLSEVRTEWLKLSGEYTATVGSYSAAIDRARHQRSGERQ